jgi:predicted PhzF superfamily epimerase YddE/YHI9
MELELYQVDAFAERPFEGNPAAVCPLDAWLPDGVMQSIAAEHNLSETAFFVAEGAGYRIRWFTPVREVPLCGHATLAAAHVLFGLLGHPGSELRFRSASGPLTVRREGDWLEMDFPARPPVACPVPEAVSAAFASPPQQCLKADDYLVVLGSEDEVAEAEPDMAALRRLDLRGVAITARGRAHDFVCRFFAPKLGLDEDPVTGSAFTQLIPYWAGVLGKDRLAARQVSRRGGEVLGGLAGPRVTIAGRAVGYLEGRIRIPDPA